MTIDIDLNLLAADEDEGIEQIALGESQNIVPDLNQAVEDDFTVGLDLNMSSEIRRSQREFDLNEEPYFTENNPPEDDDDTNTEVNDEAIPNSILNSTGTILLLLLLYN